MGSQSCSQPGKVVMVQTKKQSREFLKMIKWFFVNLWFKLYLNIIGAIYIVKEQILRRPRSLPPYSSQAGKTIVITGGGRGIGEQAVKRLVRLGARVIMGCRSPEMVKKKFDDIFKEDSGDGSVEVYHLDLMSLASVRSFAQTTPYMSSSTMPGSCLVTARRQKMGLKVSWPPTTWDTSSCPTCCCPRWRGQGRRIPRPGL